MRITYSTIFFIHIWTSFGYSEQIITPSQTFDIQKKIFNYISTELLESLLELEILCIYRINSSSDDIQIQLGIFDPGLVGIGGCRLMWFYSILCQFNRESGVFVVEGPQETLKLSNLIHDRNYVIIDQKKVTLEIPPPVNDDPFETKTNYLDIVSIDSSMKLLGGMVRWDTQSNDGHYFFSHCSIHTWDPDTGKQRLYIPYPYYSKFDDAPSTKIQFSPLNRFLIASALFKSRSIKDIFTICYSSCALLDVNTGQIIPSNRDVAFTSNERYYCTERNGLPSLVDAQTHEVLFTYKTDTPMTACCFTPDNQKLFIACEDLNIFEFDSHVPLSSVTDWELYDR